MSKPASLILVLFLGAIANGQTTDKEIIKLGTLATETSPWGQVLKSMNAELVKQTGGRLEIRFFFGRDEQDLVALLKSKQCDAALLTTIGLGQILPAINVFQLPMLFSEYEEWDHVRVNLTDEFITRFDHAGYAFLGWAEVGFVYLFSKEMIRTQTDLQRSKVWAWNLDPIARAFASTAGRDPVLLPIESVLSSLRNDEIQTVYGSPLACIVSQWQTEINYVTDFPLSMGIGAMIMDKTRFSRLSDEFRRLLSETAMKYHRQLIDKIRESNEESLQILLDGGLKMVEVPRMEVSKWRRILGRVQNQFVGQLYEQDLLDRVRDLVQRYRAQK